MNFKTYNTQIDTLLGQGIGGQQMILNQAFSPASRCNSDFVVVTSNRTENKTI